MGWGVAAPKCASKATPLTFSNPFWLGTPEPARQRRLADRVALAGAGFASCAARATDPVVALFVDEDIAAGLRRKLRPTARERPIGCCRGGRIFDRRGGSVTSRGLCNDRCEEKN